MGDITAKARVAYGKAIRPPPPYANQTVKTSSYIQLSNPNLGPERQVGTDAGLELYFARRGSLEITYYDQTAIDLLDAVVLPDSVYTYQYQNVGRIKNKGWEFRGRVDAGELSLTGTYSITTSVVRTLSPTYGGDLRPGDEMLHIPGHTAGVGLGYRWGQAAVDLAMTYIGSWTEYDYVALNGYYYGGQPYFGSQRGYWMTYFAFVKLKPGGCATLTDTLRVFLLAD